MGQAKPMGHWFLSADAGVFGPESRSVSEVPASLSATLP